MTDCVECIAARISGPCPHEAERAVKRYGREQYAAGLRAGLDALLAILVVVNGHQERGSRRRPIPLSLIRVALRGRVGHMLELATAVDQRTADAWKDEARSAFDGEKS